MNKLTKIIIPFILLFCFGLVGCQSISTVKQPSDIKTISDVNLPALSKYKDSYVGDNSAVIAIVHNLPTNNLPKKFSLQTKAKPYGITIIYEYNSAIDKEEYNKFWSKQNPKVILEKNAIVLFSLVKNVDIINFELKDSKEQIYSYKRADLEKLYGVDFRNLPNDISSWKTILNK